MGQCRSSLLIFKRCQFICWKRNMDWSEARQGPFVFHYSEWGETISSQKPAYGLFRSFMWNCQKSHVDFSKAACGFFRNCMLISQKLHSDLTEATYAFVRGFMWNCQKLYMYYCKLHLDWSKVANEIVRS